MIHENGTEVTRPTVYTEQTTYTPETLVKKDYGVIMIDGTRKRTVPWHVVTGVAEEIPAEDACGKGITGGN